MARVRSQPSEAALARCLVATALAWICIGCAFGQKHSYRDVAATLAVRGETSVGVAAHDQRDFIVSGDKQPDFVGLQRSGGGIPYGVTTQSGQPLARDFTDVVAGALSRSGYASTRVYVGPSESRQDVLAKLRATDADRLLLLTLIRWKTDTYNSTSLGYDVTLEVLDPSGNLLAKSRVAGKDDLGGSIWNPPGHAKKAVPEAYRQKIEELFRAPGVRDAL